MSLARPERLSPRSAPGDPVGAIAESLLRTRCRNVLPRWCAVVDLPTSSGVLKPLRVTPVKRKRAPCEEPFSVSLARPERFELPTFWFVAQLGFSRLFQINNLGGPPSPDFPSSLAESRRERFQSYVLERSPGPLQGLACESASRIDQPVRLQRLFTAVCHKGVRSAARPP